MTDSSASPLRTVRLLRMPVDVWVQAKQHNDELMREFTLIAAGREQEDEQHVPARLVTLLDTLRRQYGTATEERDAMLFAAHAAGTQEMDIQLQLPTEAGQHTTALGRLLDEADDYCRRGQHLLTLATPPRAVRFRHWYLGEVAAQLDGAEPTPWPAFAGR